MVHLAGPTPYRPSYRPFLTAPARNGLSFSVSNLSSSGRSSARMGQLYPMLSWEEIPDPNSLEVEKVETPTENISTLDADAARKEMIHSSNRLEAMQRDVDNLRASTWKKTAQRAASQCYNEYKYLLDNVQGKTGNPDAEAKLMDQWVALLKLAVDAVNNPPSWWAEVVDKVSQFLSDFLGGAQKAWQDYSQWTVEHAGPVLKDYYDASSRVIDLRNDLNQAKASGKYSQQDLDAQEAAISKAESLQQAVRTAYSILSVGGSIDQVAQDKYGAYKALGLGGWFLIVLQTVIIAGVVAAFAAFVYGVYKMGAPIQRAAESVADWIKDHPAIIVGGLFALAALIVLPLTLSASSAISGKTKALPEGARA